MLQLPRWFRPSRPRRRPMPMADVTDPFDMDTDLTLERIRLERRARQRAIARGVRRGAAIGLTGDTSQLRATRRRLVRPPID